MGIYKRINTIWKKPKENLGFLWQERLIKWRKGPAVVKIERPTRLDKARTIGYKAKTGFVVARVRVGSGGRMREKQRKGRRTKHARRRKIVGKSYQWIAEERANRKFHNLEVLNSYWLAKDGKHYWFECILIDPERPEIKADPRINWICSSKHHGRVFRGLTLAGKRSRGLLGKGRGYEKMRPSLSAHSKRGK